MSQPSCFAEEVEQDFADRSHEAELLLFDVCREGRTEFLTSERAYLARELSWDERKCRQELTRVRNVLRLQSICGSPADREAALNECLVANDLHAKESPKLEAKIAELRSKLSGLSRDATGASRRVEQQADAVTQLRTHCPASIVEGVNQARRVLDAGIGQDLRDAKSRHHELMCNLNIGNVYDTPLKHIEYGLLRSLPAAVAKIVVNQILRYDFSAEWPSLKAQCQREFDELTGKLPGLQAEYDEQVRQLEIPLDHYSDPKNSEEG